MEDEARRTYLYDYCRERRQRIFETETGEEREERLGKERERKSKRFEHETEKEREERLEEELEKVRKRFAL